MEIVIPAGRNGPDRTANGGYAAGSLARFVAGPATVRLSVAPPLDTPLRVERHGHTVTASAGDELVMSATSADLELDTPAPVDPGAAAAAIDGYPGFVHRGASRCFVCGVDRPHPDGLRLFTGPVEGRDVVAAPWIPHASLGDGVVDPRIVWAVLDCPGAWAATVADPEGMPYFAALGTMTASLEAPVVIGVPHVVMGWYLGTEGRKLHTAAAITTADGGVVARARHIEVKVPVDWAS